jgi:hypothetical protein
LELFKEQGCCREKTTRPLFALVLKEKKQGDEFNEKRT